MSRDVQRIVENVFCEVIEQIAFMFGEPEDKFEIAAGGTAMARASMSFQGPCAGRLELAVPMTMRLAIASNVLGIDMEDDSVDKFADDAVKEVLNVACGNILTELAGTDPVFDLSVPTISPLNPSEWETFRDDPLTVGLLVEDDPVLVRLTVDGEIP